MRIYLEFFYISLIIRNTIEPVNLIQCTAFPFTFIPGDSNLKMFVEFSIKRLNKHDESRREILQMHTEMRERTAECKTSLVFLIEL